MIGEFAGLFGKKVNGLLLAKLKRFAVVVLLVWIAFSIVAFALTRLFAWGVCEWYGSETGREVRYATFIGCMVKVNDAWVPKNELRIVQ